MQPLNGNSLVGDGVVRVSAPGRICLFGEHQDYLGLPVIAAAIDLRVTVEAIPIDEPGFHLHLPDTGERYTLAHDRELPHRHGRDYLSAAINVLRREGLSWQGGWKVSVRGSIPLNSGASSSSALQVAWCALLMALAGDDRTSDPEEIARVAHRSEVTEFGAPGGMMDHFSCAVGGIIWLDTRPPYHVRPLFPPLGEFVLVDSGIPKDTNGVLGEKRRRVEALAITHDGTDVPPPPGLTETDRPLYTATVINRRLTDEALGALTRGAPDQEVGALLTRHQEQLSRNLGTSLPQIDALLESGLQAGALGGKINGSGCGGSFFLYCPGTAERVRDHYRSMGLKAWIVRVDQGVRVIKPLKGAEVTP